MSDEQPRLEVHMAYSVLFQWDNPPELFVEGSPTQQAKARLQRITERLKAGYLAKVIQAAQASRRAGPWVQAHHAELLSRLVGSLTSEAGLPSSG